MNEHTALKDLDRDFVRDAFADVELRTLVLPVNDLQWRESQSGDGSRVFSGYAAVFDTETTLYAGTHYVWREKLDPHCFDEVLASDPDVHFNMGHDMNRSMARTKARGPMSKLELSVDTHGLRVYARLNPENRTVQELMPLMDDGVMDQMSFAFRVRADGMNTETVKEGDGPTIETDTIMKVAELIDVCVCARGAYPTTEASLRTLLTGSGAHVANREVTRTGEGAHVANREVPSQMEGAQDSPAVDRARALLLAEAEAAVLTYRPKKEG
jgi:HK97 family phage prohead protease